MREVQNKWQTLKMNDDIWAKLIYFEQNRRLAKAYVSTPVLSIDGSTSGLDGLRIGLSGIENSRRSLESIASLRSIGQGIRLRIDAEGNILVRRVGSAAANSNCSVWVKDWPPAGTGDSACASPLSASSLSDSYTSAGSSASSSSMSSPPPSPAAPTLLDDWNVKRLTCELADEEPFSSAGYKLFDMRRFRAELERQRRQQMLSGRDGDQPQLVDWRQCVSIICFVRNSANAPSSKQSIIEDKLNRNPQRILKEPCWLMLINIIAIDMLKSLLCDNKSNIRPALPMSLRQHQHPYRSTNSNSSNNNNNNNNEIHATGHRYETAHLADNKQYNGAHKTRTGTRTQEQHSEDGADVRYQLHHRGSSYLDRFNFSYKQTPNRNFNRFNSKFIAPSAIKGNSLKSYDSAPKLKTSSSVASLHPSAGDKSTSSSSGVTNFADYLLSPAGNIINYFSNGRKHLKASISSNNRQSLKSGNVFHSTRKQANGLSSAAPNTVSERNNAGNFKNKLSDSPASRQIDQIYSKSDYIRFHPEEFGGHLRLGRHSSSQQQLGVGHHSDANHYDYSYIGENDDYGALLEDDDAIYTTFTGKHLYDNRQRKRTPVDEIIYSATSPLSSAPEDCSEAGLGGGRSMKPKTRQTQALYPMEVARGQKPQKDFGQSRSSFDLSHGHKLDLRPLKASNSIRMNFDSDEGSPGAATKRQLDDATVRSRRAFSAFNKKASEWSRLARRFAISAPKSSSSYAPSSARQSLDSEASYQPQVQGLHGDKAKPGANETCLELEQQVSRSSLVSSSSGCPENDYIMSQSSSSSSAGQSTANDGDASNNSGNSQPASSSGIACSGNTSDDCCGDAKHGPKLPTDCNGTKNEMEVPSTRASRKSDAIQRQKRQSLIRAISRDRYNNVKLLHTAETSCGPQFEFQHQQLECDCQDCGYLGQAPAIGPAHQHGQELDDFISCDCCCDCFYDGPPVVQSRVPDDEPNVEASAPVDYT